MASAFRQRLAALRQEEQGRRWLFVPYDQLTDRLGPLAREDPGSLGIILIETPAKARRRPYHKQKLAFVLANLRRFALEQAERGVAVRHVVADDGYAAALAPLAEELGPLRMREAAERELRLELKPLVETGRLEVLPHEGWLTTEAQFRATAGDKLPWRMDAFYRRVRRDSGILMEDGKPRGGKFSFDTENRKPWKGEPPAPEVPRWEPDELVEEVVALVAHNFADHPGRLDPGALVTSRAQARAHWEWALRACLPHFGPYEDALSSSSTGLFHTRIAHLLNLGLLEAAEVIDDVLAAGFPLASTEGFVRQILGWREFVRHVHRATDGFRVHPQGDAIPLDDTDAAAPSVLGADRPLPPAWWGEPSGMACLDDAVANVWDEAWSHHIARLMVLANLATLLDVRPRELTDWFWVAYLDAFDWVVEPNVLAMGTYGTGGLMTSKPYVCGAAYLNKMGDHCKGCAFDPKRDCPITSLYWAFLERHQEALAGLPRLAMPLRTLGKRTEARRAHDREVAERTWKGLAAGAVLRPADFPPAP